ncbi:hypothetical protein ILUMI_23836 [Ignelater luminosus]|uniref:Receptor-type tyrosine-protein phosphatase N2 n=1 Tax=Ignelater luminosus TaxID=2038154 RepID=A0A8K0CDU1_IGNLU|nr:hypothetical protein ILUMI_23836 [Ignelater luminosus]
MPGPSGALRFALLFLIATVGPPGVYSEENVGCLFSPRLCLEELEWCYDDFAFGRCLPTTGNIDEEELYRYNLDRETLHALSRELRRLFALGYRWSHAYTQCRLQGMLFAAKNEITFEHNTCSHLVDQDLEGALKALEGEDQIDPEKVAIVKFTPSVEDPHAEFADEIYYPPMNDAKAAARDIILPPNAVDIFDMPDPYAQYEVTKRAWIPQMHRRSLPLPSYFSKQYNTPLGFRLGEETRDSLEYLPKMRQEPYDNEFLTNDIQEEIPSDLSLEDLSEFYPMINFLSKLHLTTDDVRNLLLPKNYPVLQALLDEFEKSESAYDTNIVDLLRQQIEEDQLEKEYPDVPERFSLMYNTPDSFRAGWESRDIQTDEELPESRVYFDENEDDDSQRQEYGSGERTEPEEIFRELKHLHEKYGYDFDDKNQQIAGLARRVDEKGDAESQSGVYTEGGVVYVPDSQIMGEGRTDTEDSLNDDLDDLLERYSKGFKRPERLDVKKPGPPFDSQISAETGKAAARTMVNDKEDILLPSMMKKEPRGAHPNPSHEPYDVDTDFVYVKFKESLSTWQQGEEIIGNISELLHLEPKAITHGRVETNEVTFKINKNSQNLNATEVAKRIGFIKDKLQTATGMHIVAAGVGDRTKLQAVFTTKIDEPVEFYVIALLLAGLCLTFMVTACVLLVIRRHIISREKLHGLTRPDSEASKDYQDLCRARMASKTQPQSETVHGRITSLSRESEQSPSSRSSTSSWSEEPALHNMDISTGHMVLSYMEDHLRNKDRLEQEWVALCAYEAEPCATTMALKKENVEKNRYPDVLPYDHARVVLNDLTNASGCDYINASSITDHDPRNPAYIAAQGPLPHTAPDFWQLIWEQGAVVIVMLTRLTEGGAAMCHRYWPEEGSELYHVYEVHLVSEHIWCDDYLVRSFYLKNTRTGETRTVTQFHFLSWPEAGIPSSTKALLEFRRKVNKSYRGRSCPIVVHCSDGAGRTGTYCLIDMVLSRMAKGAKEIDIAATLEHLRDQRPRMVATKQQFEFVLTAVAEEVHAILKALPPQPAPGTQPTEKEKEKEKQ